MSKTNSFFKIIKNINKSINSLLEKNLNKLKVKNFIKLAKSNKIFLTIVAVLILFLSYLSVPNIYNQNEISKRLKNDLLNSLQININFTTGLDYKFFPRPHFVSSDSSILLNQNIISEIKKIKIYLSLENLFSLKKIKVEEIVLENANFNLNKKNYNFFIKLLDNDFSNMKLKILNSNIFFKNMENEVLLINNILKAEYLYDTKNLKKILFSKNEIFNLPYLIELSNDKVEKKLYTRLNSELFRLQIDNHYFYDDKNKKGSIEFIFNNLKSTSEYQINENLFEFKFFDKVENPKFFYEGKFNFKPFHSYINGNSNKLNISYLFESNAIIPQLLKTEILNNKNVDFNLNLNSNVIENLNDFENIQLRAKIKEGLIDIDNTILTWKNSAVFELLNSLIYIKDGELIIDGSLKINFINSKELYKFLLTPKNYRKKISQIDLNYTYNFDKKLISLKDIRVDNKLNKNLNETINSISFKNDRLQNKIYLKKLLNDAIKIYAG